MTTIHAGATLERPPGKKYRDKLHFAELALPVEPASPAAAKRYVLTRSGLVAVPTSPGAFLRSPLLSLPANYSVEVIPSGCCGMAGSFGYEREHFDVSMAIGELVLFPAVRAAVAATILAAPGTSCRHQIKDGTGRIARHPVEILRAALSNR